MTLIELLDIYIYTYGDKNTGKVWWSPLMLKLRDVNGEYFEDQIGDEEKSRKNQKFSIPKREESNENDSFVFLYLEGDKGKWNWGRVGGVNSAFIQKESRAFLRNSFKMF